MPLSQPWSPWSRKFFEASEADFGDYALLHAFRIEGKHLRYAMEIFAAAFEPSFRDQLYPLIADLQDRLGKINDHATASERFTSWLSESDVDDALRSTLETLVAEEQKRWKSPAANFWIGGRPIAATNCASDLPTHCRWIWKNWRLGAEAAEAEPQMVLRRAE